MSKNETATHRHLARKFSTILGLAGLAVIHIMDLPGKWEETRYLAFGYIGIIAVAAVLIERILHKGTARDYAAAAALSLSVIVGFVIDRTTGMPGAMGDIGNWFEPLGLLSLFVEAWAAWQAIAGLKLALGDQGDAVDYDAELVKLNASYSIN